jgi:hypothetical protein
MDWVAIILGTSAIGAGIAAIIFTILGIGWILDRAKHDKYISDLGKDEHERNQSRK